MTDWVMQQTWLIEGLVTMVAALMVGTVVYFCVMLNIKINMKTKITKSCFLLVAAPTPSVAAVSNGTLSYLIGGIIALIIMGYLVYTLLYPEKF